MPFLGTRLLPREIARLCWNAGWRDKALVEAVAVCLGESQGYVRAYNDNVDDETGRIKSRDVGLFEINIAAEAIGTDRERRLYDPKHNVATARSFYERRGWQPWYAWTNGWVTFPEWWVWSSKGLGWVPTGRYMHKAVRGVANFYAEELGLDVPLVEYQAPRRPWRKPKDGVGVRPTPPTRMR